MHGVFKCKNCGNQIDLSTAISGVIECDYCSSKFPVPKKETSPVALDFLRQGEHDLDTCKFDEAYTAYSKAAQYDGEEPEAYWGMAIAEFKVQYIKDTVNNRLQPICHEFTEKRFSQSRNYLLALRYATPNQKVEYEKRANEIDYIRSEFLKLKQSGLDYDCFICVKVSRIDEDPLNNSKKNWTDDAFRADAIYDLLKRKNFTPFFSEREIRNRTGADYEAMILYALYTSETMLVVCNNEEYLQTPWVKNEYTRFKQLVNNKEKEDNSLTIVYNSSPIEKLPGSNGKIQGIDYSRREADFEIVKFVETHTPLARAKREEANRKKQKEEDEYKRLFAEQKKIIEEQRKRQEELERKMASSYSSGAGMSDEELFEKFERIKREKERKAREEAERKAREAKAREEAERRAREAKAREEAERRQREEAARRAREQEILRLFDIKGNVLVSCKDRNIKEANIPQGVTSIGEFAFCNCQSLTSVTIPQGVTMINKSAFNGCSKLTSVTIPWGVTLLGDAAFSGCRSLTSVTIPLGVTHIGGHAFYNCSSLTSIKIPYSVNSIGDSAFYGCSSLTSIEIPNSVYFIGNSAFGSCHKIKSIMIPSSVLKIDADAFANNSLIKCEVKYKPKDWHKNWNGFADNRTKVIWDALSVEGQKKALAEESKTDEQKEQEKRKENRDGCIAVLISFVLFAMFIWMFFGLNWLSSWHLFWRIVISVVISAVSSFVGVLIVDVILESLIERFKKRKSKSQIETDENKDKDQ